TSSLIDETNSKPPNAKAICGQKFTVFQSQCGWILLHVNCVCEPWRYQTHVAAKISIISGTNVPTAPAFCSHFPMRSPTMFITTATKNSANETISKKGRFCAIGAYP